MMNMLFRTTKKKYRIGTYASLALLFLLVHYALELEMFSGWERYLPVFRKLSISLFLIFLIFLLGKVVEKIIDTRNETEGIRYNLLRITRLLTVIFVLIIAIAFLFQNLYAAAVSFGLLSLILGFALQAPIASFIAWLYIVLRRPYQVGDRIEIEGFKGDVLEVNYLDTLILEFSGGYLQNDRTSGRVIHFPNSIVLKSQVINYSGPFVPFIWNETPLHIGYTSDLKFVEGCLIKAAMMDFEERYPQYGSGEIMELKPAVYFRVNTYAWLEAVVSYPVEPEDTTGRRNRILRLALPLLNEHPEKVKFPEGTLR